MPDFYIAKVRENLSKTWEYYFSDNEDLDDLKEEIAMAKRDGDMSPNALVTYYKVERIE